MKPRRELLRSWHTLNNEETSELLYHGRKTGGGTKKVNRILQIVLLHLNSQIWWWCILRAWRKQGYSSRRLGEGRAGEGRGWLSADSATLINVIWSWQWTPNSSRPWSSCRSPLPVPNSPNYRNIAQQIKCGVICRLPRHFITHSWQRVRGPLLDCLTWHLSAIPFIIVCIYRNERAGYFVRPVIKSSRGEASFFFSPLNRMHRTLFLPSPSAADDSEARKLQMRNTSSSVTVSLWTERGCKQHRVWGRDLVHTPKLLVEWSNFSKRTFLVL